jgi:HD-GYP domain-containing protein (c-di-GMP phosphodiesterase class II)
VFFLVFEYTPSADWSNMVVLKLSLEKRCESSAILVNNEAMERLFGTQDLKFADILASLSYALDLTSGHPMGHAQRACLIGVRLAQDMGLSAEVCSALYYALLMKDSGCSSNAARMYEIFGHDDLDVKRASRVVDWSNLIEAAKYAAQNTLPEGSFLARAKRLIHLATHQEQTSGEFIQARCSRGEQIAHSLGLGPLAGECIRCLDEHWDGRGQPAHLSGDDIPLLARIACLAQTMEVFATTYGPDAAFEVARKRAGKWFDPQLVRLAQKLWGDTEFWAGPWREPREALLHLDLQSAIQVATDVQIDAVCDAFAQIVDAKSSFTGEHSLRVCEYSVKIAQGLGIGGARLTIIRRAALLHDVGKLAVSNAILDKPDRPTEEEWTAIKRHPYHTQQILSQITGFERLASVACAHHERLDGRGYFRGLTAAELDLDMRILAVADVFDALLAERPYRSALPREQVFAIMGKDAGVALDAECIEVLRAGEFVLPRAA